MEFSRIVLLCLAVAAVGAGLTAGGGVAAQRSPSCASRCGNVEVPYPFGLDEACAINSSFHLNCSSTGGTTKLFHSNMEVIRISVRDNKAWVKTLISRQCYNRSTRQVEVSNEKSLDLTGTPYVLSAEDNRVTVIGCNNLAYMQSNEVSNLDTS
jgi:hypothetical protein